MKNKKKLIWWLPAVAVMVVIFLFSQMGARESSALSGGLVRRLLSFLEQIGLLPLSEHPRLADILEVVIRKLAHGCEYALLGGCLVLPFAFHLEKRGRVLFLFSAGFAALYACSDALHQLFISGRAGRLLDVGIDTFGACIGTLLVMLLIRKNLENI